VQLRIATARLDDAAAQLRDTLTGLVAVGIESDWQSPAATSYRTRFEESVQALSGVIGLAELAVSTVDAEAARLEALGD